MDEIKVLRFDPFQGDYGGSGDYDRVLKDKMVTARKPGPCHHCSTTIQPGDRVRSRSEIYDGDMMSFRWCSGCCEVMQMDESTEQAFDSWERRRAAPVIPH